MKKPLNCEQWINIQGIEVTSAFTCITIVKSKESDARWSSFQFSTIEKLSNPRDN